MTRPAAGSDPEGCLNPARRWRRAICRWRRPPGWTPVRARSRAPPRRCWYSPPALTAGARGRRCRRSRRRCRRSAAPMPPGCWGSSRRPPAAAAAPTAGRRGRKLRRWMLRPGRGSPRLVCLTPRERERRWLHPPTADGPCATSSPSCRQADVDKMCMSHQAAATAVNTSAQKWKQVHHKGDVEAGSPCSCHSQLPAANRRAAGRR